MKKKYLISWEGPIAGYAYNYISKNYWRLSRIMEVEDARQEAYVVYLKVKRAYGSSVDNGAWFMSLYKVALRNRFNDLSDKSSAVTNEVVGTSMVDTKVFDKGFLSCVLEDAPEEVKGVISLFLDAPKELLDLAIEAWQHGGKKKIHGNQFICKMLGYDHSKIDLPLKVKKYLGE